MKVKLRFFSWGVFLDHRGGGGNCLMAEIEIATSGGDEGTKIGMEKLYVITRRVFSWSF